jgi:hypothetical protein
VLRRRRDERDHVDQRAGGIHGHEVPLPERFAAQRQRHGHPGGLSAGVDGFDVVHLDRDQPTGRILTKCGGHAVVVALDDADLWPRPVGAFDLGLPAAVEDDAEAEQFGVEVTGGSDVGGADGREDAR